MITKIAIIQQTNVVNAIVFDEPDEAAALKMAQDWLAAGHFADADDVQVLPEGFGIGDMFVDGNFEKPPMPEIEDAADADALVDAESGVESDVESAGFASASALGAFIDPMEALKLRMDGMEAMMQTIHASVGQIIDHIGAGAQTAQSDGKNTKPKGGAK